jgi:murein DD-endopeptidase MepM/ murein hydrolase activator NlpD
MLRAATTATRVSCAALAVLALVAGIVLALRSSPARALSIGQLQQKISAGRSRISGLAGAVGADSGRLSQLNSGIASLQNRIARIDSELRVQEAALIKLETALTIARNRLAQLEAFEARAESVLARQLVNSYESAPPDLVTVILESNGFQDLRERLAFAQRIQKQDVSVIKAVRVSRRRVAGQAIHLGALEVRQHALTIQVGTESNALTGTQHALERQRIGVAAARQSKAGQLASARGQVASLQQQLNEAEAAQAAAAARAAAAAAAAAQQQQQQQSQASGGAGGSSAPAAATPAPAPSSGGFVFPLPKSAASPPSTWSPDQGVDISAPGDTPEYAVCSGTIVLHGIGGFGPWAPVLHCDSPIDGYSYVYYGHAGPEYQLPVGTHVSAGQVMSSIGPGIVGISTGPHLELGFADSSGSPIGSQTAGTMLSLLESSY